MGSWPDPTAVTLAMAAPLRELVIDGAPVAGEPWPVAAWGECGVWVERLDDDGLRPGDLGFADGGSPELLPLNARPGDAWIMHVEGPYDVATPAIDALLDHLAAALAAALDGVATDTEGFPITSR